MPRTIAIVEDDLSYLESLSEALTQHGYVVRTYSDKQEALEGFNSSLPDLAILDIMLKDESEGGFELCRALRQMSPYLPIIFLTARGRDVDRISGLRLDAWDYITKPTSLQYLMVRISSLFRIASTSQDSAGDTTQLMLGHLELDQNSMSVLWKGEPLHLTLTEFWLIEALARNPGHVKTYEVLIQITRQHFVERNTINGYVRRIRKKFKEVDPSFSMIQTVFGVGYRWKN
ncbi:MAG: response regulator [Gammaproteobacteria bacterium]|nr:response regulator [Gammaproteobacteria bacterium]MCY4217996.1 response regulator [Gammaproteobacteria bacterium]MCY4274088.1 response regulator [Gammaproteobacteria bacterium]